MEATLITDLTRTIVADRRYRRSDKVTDALAFQCAHVTDQYGLEAVVVGDETGDRWVGSGDRSLCRLLSRSAAEIARGPSVKLEYRLAALQSLRSDLDPSRVATFRIDIPGSARQVYVTGVGAGRLRDVGVVNAADGTKRILGVTPGRVPRPAVAAENPDRALQDLVHARWFQLGGGAAMGVGPRRSLLGYDDLAYTELLGTLLEPVHAELTGAGLVADSLWAGYRWRSSEAPAGDGVYVRALRAPVREARSGVQVGALIVDMAHRHDSLSLPLPPQVGLRWS